jgi:predicted outer membrane repeat protein
LLLALSGSPLLIPSAQAATITVANGAIAVNLGDAQCSLIEAINNANTDSDVSGGDCVAGSGADTINLPGGSFTFTASYIYDAGNNGLPSITSDITINGNGSTLDLGGAAVGIRLARVSASGDLTVNDATITGGYMFDATHGGGVFRVEGGSLTIDDSTLSGNATRSYGGAVFVLDNATLTVTNNTTITGNLAFRGGGVYSSDSATALSESDISGNYAERSGGGIQANRGSLSISDSTINDNGWEPGQIGVNGYVDYGGGVLSSRATLSIATTTIDGNYSSYGGGGLWVQSANDVTISQSAITNNVANGAGGGVRWGAYGDSGPYSANGSITNTTISGNVADYGGGVVVRVGELALNNVTVSDNTAGYSGGGILVDDTLTLNRTIVSGNSADSGDEVYVYSGTYGSGTATANNFNLFGHSGLTNAAAFSNFTPGATDFTATSDGTEPAALAAILAPLADNGGPTTPATPTHALVANSPALDRGPNAACLAAPVDGVDQRDEPRNVNGDGAASANECDVGAYEAPSVAPPGICPAPGNEVTTILGVGMGSPTKASLSKKLVIPNSADLVALYGQLAGKHVGKMPRFVRFSYPGGGGYVQVNTPTGTAERVGGVYWYGTELQPASSITGRWFLAPNTKGKVPRALILYATYETTASYFDTYVLYPDGATNTVGPEEPWAQSQTLTIPIDPPLAPADVTIQVALVDNDKDSRFITVNASAGPVQVGNTSTNPTHGDTLNIITFTLEDVPAGTDEVTLELLSGPNGDSATIVGAAANYACELN